MNVPLAAFAIATNNLRGGGGGSYTPSPKEPLDKGGCWLMIIALVVGMCIIGAAFHHFGPTKNTTWIREYISEYRVIRSEWYGKYLQVDVQEVKSGEIFRNVGPSGIARNHRNPYAIGQYYMILRNDFLVYNKLDYVFGSNWVKTSQPIPTN